MIYVVAPQWQYSRSISPDDDNGKFWHFGNGNFTWWLNFISLLFGLVSACSFMLSTCRYFSNVLFVSDWLFDLRSHVILLFGVCCDWLLPYFKFNWTCSVRKFITFCSSYRFSVVAPSTGFRQRKSPNFKLLPVICCIETSKCANRSIHLVSLVLFCFLHLFRLISGFNAW